MVVSSKLIRFTLAIVVTSCAFAVFSGPASAANDIIQFTDTNKCYDAPVVGDNTPPTEVTCPTDNSATKTTTSNIVNDGGVCKVPTQFLFDVVPCDAVPAAVAPTPVATGGAAQAAPPPNTMPPCAYIKNGIRTCAVRDLGNGMEFYALAAAVGGIFISASLWALGSKGQNSGQELTGKRGLAVCITAAFIIGAYPALTTWINARAHDADNTGVTTATLPSYAPPGAT